jgi:alkanesulfonate monooxygenase SsuD/methylene tetrahydromethanopterin reductase-like flavin-dependent oxidoreductase (luciferase family)
MRDAFLSPPPLQAHLPILVGGGGEKTMLGIVARYADAWNIGGTPAMLLHKSKVLDEHCERVGRDPASIWRTASANVIITDDAAEVKALRERRGWNITGNARAVQDEVAKYLDAKVSELILLNHGWGTDKELHKERYARFMQDVAPAFA